MWNIVLKRVIMRGGEYKCKGVKIHLKLKGLQFKTISVQFSCSVVSNSLQPHEPQHARPPCPSPIPGVHPNPCPLSRWCHPTISSSVVPFFSCPQSFPASRSFQMGQLFTSDCQSIGVSASTSVLPAAAPCAGRCTSNRGREAAWHPPPPRPIRCLAR